MLIFLILRQQFFSINYALIDCPDSVNSLIVSRKQEIQFCMLLKPVFSSRKRGGLKFTDEPTGSLDEDTARDITEILKDSAHRMNKCVIVVTHSGELADQADVVFRLKRGVLMQNRS